MKRNASPASGTPRIRVTRKPRFAESPAAKYCAKHIYLINQEIRNYAESNIDLDGNNYREAR